VTLSMRDQPTHRLQPSGLLIAMACLMIGWLSYGVAGGTVKHGLSTTETWVGSPIVLSLVFENVQQHDPPDMPDVPELRITATGPPSQRSAVQILNGHRTEQTTLTYRYLIDGRTPGQVVMPALALHADGKTYNTEPVSLTFLSSDDASLLRAEIRGVPSKAWLGDTIPATLQIMIKPFADSQLRDRVLSASDMWRQIQFDACHWGPFRDRIATLQSERRFPPVSLVDVTADNGTSERWYAFDVRADLHLMHAGDLDLSNIMIRMDYPVRIGRGRTDFFDPIPSLVVSDARPITARPAPSSTVVDPPPAAGRPATWAGAVGDFSFSVTATPTDVGVGEPITLTMRMTDLRPQPGDLDLLQAPKLDQDITLTQHFRVPNDRPGGVVSGNTKTFTQTIRPTSTAATEIPPIPFAYFAPSTGTWETSLSQPVALTVSSAKRVDATALSGNRPLTPLAPLDEVTEVRGGLLANYTDPSILLDHASHPGLWWLTLALLAPPIAWGLVVGSMQRRKADRLDPRRGRSRQASRVLSARLDAAGGSAEAIATALRGFVADRLGLPAGGLTSDEAVAAVQRSDQPELARALATQLEHLERSIYTGGDQRADADAARELAKQLEGSV